MPNQSPIDTTYENLRHRCMSSDGASLVVRIEVLCGENEKLEAIIERLDFEGLELFSFKFGELDVAYDISGRLYDTERQTTVDGSVILVPHLSETDPLVAYEVERLIRDVTS